MFPCMTMLSQTVVAMLLLTQPNSGSGCFKGTFFADGLNLKCVHAPMSLPCVDTATPDGDGWRPGSAKCGMKKVWGIFFVECGRPAASAACIAGF